jgi:hypothetical protein
VEGDYKSCRKAMLRLHDPKSKVRCQTCRHRHKCYEDSPEYDMWDREVRGNKGVYLG